MRDPWRPLRRRVRSYHSEPALTRREMPKAPTGGGGPHACTRRKPGQCDPGLTPARQRAARRTAMARCHKHDVGEPEPMNKEVEEPTSRGAHSWITKLKNQSPASPQAK